MNEHYWLWISELKRGPFTLGQLRSMWSVGTITPVTLYWKQGMSDWLPLGSFLDVPNSEPEAPIQQTPPTLPAFQPTPRNSNELFPSFSSPQKKLEYPRLLPPPEETATQNNKPKAIEETANQKNTKSDDFGCCGDSLGCLGLLALLVGIYYAIFNTSTTSEKVLAIVASFVGLIIFATLAQLVDSFLKLKEAQKNEKQSEVIAKRLEEKKRLEAEEEAKLPSDPFERAWTLHRNSLPPHKVSSLEKETFEKEEFCLRWEGDRGPWKNYSSSISPHSWGFPGYNEWQANYLARSVARQFTLEFPGATIKFSDFQHHSSAWNLAAESIGSTIRFNDSDVQDDKRDNIERYQKYIEIETDLYAKHAEERLLTLLKEAHADIRFAIKEFFADSSYLAGQTSADTLREIMELVEPYGWPDFEDKKPGDLSIKAVFVARITEIERLPNFGSGSSFSFDDVCKSPNDTLNMKDSSGLRMYEETWRYGTRHVKSRFPKPHIFPSSGFVG